MSNKSEELKARIEARKHELLAVIETLKADTRHEAGATRDKVKAKLDELQTHLKDGWTHMSEGVRTKLHGWLAADQDVKPEAKPDVKAAPPTPPSAIAPPK